MTSFQQVYYTSCEAGVRGGKGFQILAHSENMAAPLLRAVEQLAAYSPPRSSPTRPTAEDIERFPVSLLYQRLKDGPPVIARNRYVGRDYSGRFGNFFMHALISEAPTGAPLPLAPICLWDADFWRHEGAGVSTQGLPSHALDVGRYPFDRQSVARFLQEGNRLSWVSKILGAVEAALSTGRRVIVVDSDVNVAGWVRFACSVLPDGLSRALTFDTYARSPYERDVLFVGTCSDTDFRFSPHEMEYQFFVFDMNGNRSSKTLPETPFSRVVAKACAEGKYEAVAAFPAFVRSARLEVGASDLSDAATYFAIKSRLAVDQPESARTLGWCAQHVEALDVEGLRDALRMLLKEGTDQPAMGESLCGLLRACQAPGREAAARACREALAPWLFEVVTGGRDIEWISPLLASAPSLVHPYSESVLMEMRRKTEVCNDARRCRTLLEILDHIGALGEKSAKSRDLGASKTDLLLSDDEARAFLARKVGSRVWREFFAGGVARCNQTLGPSGSLSPEWERFLGSDGVREVLLAIASEVGAADVQREIGRLGVAGGSVDPAKMMERWRREQRQIDPQAIDRMYRALFANRVPTLKEATAIAAALRGDAVTPATFDGLGRPLLDDAELRRPNPERQGLATTLLQVRCVALAPVTTAVASVNCLVAHMQEMPALLRPAQMGEIERHLRWLPDTFVAPVVTLVAATLLEAAKKQEPETHRTCYAAGVAAFGEASFQALVRYAFMKIVGKSAQQKDGRAETMIAALFAAWAPSHRVAPTPASSYFMREVLPQALREHGGLADTVPHSLNGARSKRRGGKEEPLSRLWDDWVAQNRPPLWQRILG